MYSSPGTPTGTGRSRASSTSSRALACGRPIGTGPSGTSTPGSIRYSEQFTVASVGP